MQGKHRLSRTLRWVLSALIVAAGWTTAWAWGSAAEPRAAAPVTPVLYAAWQPTGAPEALLFRSTDQGISWEQLALPAQARPVSWAGDGAHRVVVSLSDGQVFSSDDRGKSWKQVAGDLPVLSLVWDGQGNLYLGTAGHGIYRQTVGGALEPIAAGQQALTSNPVSHLVLVDGRLFAATPADLFYTDDGGQSWTQTQPVAGGISALAAADARTLFVGTPAHGLFRSIDAGQTWQPASAGLGEAAGVYLSITALRADPEEAGVLYAAVSSLVGGTELHSAAVGTFVTLDGGQSWQPLAGPSFPQAKPASALLPAPGQPLYVWSVAADGLQSYAPDVAGALGTLQQSTGDVPSRATAARILGLARTQAASGSLLAAMADPSPAVSQAAGEALGRIADSQMTSDLLLALQSPVPQVQHSAATALGMMRAEAAVEPLSAMLLRGDPAMAGIAAGALGRSGSQDATQALLTALADARMTTRRHAALGALETMGEPAVIPLQQMLAGSPDAAARGNAAEALGWIGSPSANAALVQALGDSDSTVRARTAWALGEVAAPQALEPSLVTGGAASAQAAGQTLTRIAERPIVPTSVLATWALALSRWAMLGWLILALSMMATIWLLVGNRRRSLAPVVQRVGRR
ncbi:MAG TPA: HEAT repeat domain-containing protein [Anaerolineae bacterium]|nr:HEAT repeat domain-containing protein [Anaerolineae bacterium]